MNAHDHYLQAESLLAKAEAADTHAEADRLIRVAQVHATLAQAATTTPQVAYTPPAALLRPPPKGFRCVGCGHSVNLHRAGGCDVRTAVDEICPCGLPFGHLPAGDPDPSGGAS